ncbi:MAG TPA: serine hydrolase domain-containing protein [Pseudonocardiaceae bacterium]|nr:serine hydrolase domain-containing protein [Pseudonocardiaceae bacterium]
MAGLSTTRMRRVRDALARYVDNGTLPGAVAVASRHGDTHVETVGTTELGGGTPMREDTIFRIASMTKPVAAVAAMTFVEECRLRLDDPVDPLLPELADRRVLVSVDGPLDDTVPAARPITLRDLLTFRPGFGMLDDTPVGRPILAAARRLGVGGGPPHPAAMPDPDAFLRGLGELPLMYQPGERWLYHTGSDVLGVLLERLVDRPLDEVLQERVFDPLGMVDTAFSVPADRIHRLPPAYLVDHETGEPELLDHAEGGEWASPPPFRSAGGGLVSTAADFLAFGTMMLRQGRYEGGRVLSRPSVRLMTTDQLTREQKALSGFFPGYFDHQGWGFGMCVLTGRNTLAATPGRFGWYGGLGTAWATDPAEDLVAILLTQRSEFPELSPVHQDFWTSVYQAVD